MTQNPPVPRTHFYFLLHRSAFILSRTAAAQLDRTDDGKLDEASIDDLRLDDLDRSIGAFQYFHHSDSGR